MNNNQYIEALKKALAGLDKSSRNDIVQEIQSHAKESGDSLRDRFGAPDVLAQQYLEGEIVARPLSAKIWGISKKLFIAVGAVVIALIVVGLLLFWWVRKDAFDYANESAPELVGDNTAWITEPWTGKLDLKLEQASAVIYWHADASIRYSCKGQLPTKANDSSMTFERSKCLLYLPQVPTSINAFQSQLVLVRPQQSIDMQLKQAELRMAENGTEYRYSIDASRTRIDGLSSIESAELEISIESYEADISEYRY